MRGRKRKILGMERREKKREREREREIKRERERERERLVERERSSSWFTCRHGNAVSPLTCYSRSTRTTQRDLYAHYPFLFGMRWDTESRLLSRYPLTSASICLLCKSHPTGADVDGNTNAETGPSTISPTNTLNGEQLVIARVAYT